jgi:hypothetical protein
MVGLRRLRIILWTQISHQLAGMVEPSEAADLGDQRRRVHHRDAAQRLQGFDHRRQRP